MHDKNDERIKIVSPVAGTVTDVVRGARRHVERIVVAVGDGIDAAEAKSFVIDATADRSTLCAVLADAGLWVELRRRPFADVPSMDVVPRDIFVTMFDSSPLAVDRRWDDHDIALLTAGVKMLSRMTDGRVYVSHRAGSEVCLGDGERIVDVTVRGPHPAGLPGVQAANIAPLGRGETIWTLSAETLWRIGRLITDGVYDGSTVVTVCGSCVDEPYLIQTVIGAQVKELLKGHVRTDRGRVRVISGNVLTGRRVELEDGFLHSPYTQITIIPEGDEVDEFMGWASLSPRKMSISPTFPGRWLRRFFDPDARIGGGRRAIIMSGEYDRVVPMDILCEYLIKAIQSRDIEAMEKLGILEVAPEDFALAECLDTSRLPLQQMVREGLDFVRNA